MLQIRDLLLTRNSSTGALLPAFIHTHSAEWTKQSVETPQTVTLAAFADSFYEYLLKVSSKNFNINQKKDKCKITRITYTVISYHSYTVIS